MTPRATLWPDPCPRRHSRFGWPNGRLNGTGSSQNGCQPSDQATRASVILGLHAVRAQPHAEAAARRSTMSNPLDEETYGDKTDVGPDETKQGNPGRPQSDFLEPPAEEADDQRSDEGSCTRPAF